LKGILKAPELEGSSKKRPDELQNTNEKEKTYMRDMTKPVGDACRDDGTLKDADELEWPDSPTELVAPQKYFEDSTPSHHSYDDEPAPHPEGEFDRRSSTPLDVTFVESENEITVPQKRTKVSIRLSLWSKWYSLSD
jgi:hypothetical protein